MATNNKTADKLTDDSRFEFSAEEIKRIEYRWKSDVDLKLSHIYDRLHTIERLVWMAVGGTVVIGALAAFGINTVIRHGDRIDAIALRQAAAIGQREAHVDALKQRDAELQSQLERLQERAVRR